MPSSPLSSSPQLPAAEAKVRALIVGEKWRQARDELKPLVKSDRERFLPLLIQANLGLARKMLASGQPDDARQVLNHLATIAPAAQLRALEFELAVKSGVSEGSLPQFLAAVADPGIPLNGAERVRIADAIVLSFPSAITSDPALPDQARQRDELRAVHDALRAVSEARWHEALESLRRVPHRSVFGHWATFVKGLVAFHAGETERAAKLWRSVPPESVPAKASQPYLLLAGDPAAGKTNGPVLAAVIDGVCRIAGANAASDILLRAERLWREGNPAESYRVVRDGAARFPSEELDWLGALTEFYFKAPHGMAESAWVDFLRFFTNQIARDRVKNRVESMLAYRLLALMGRAVAPADELREDWEAFLHEHGAIHGPNPRLASLGYGWLGEQLAMTPRSSGFFAGRPRLRDAESAVAALRKSIELDSANLAAHLQLCAVYAALKKHGERNRLLDEMAARFPDDKQVLVAAARGCIERKAFAKGLSYLARARQLDQLDPHIPELTVAGLYALARQQFLQRRPDPARQTLARAEEWLIDQRDDFQRSRWTAWARHAVMERLWGDATQAAALLAQSRQRASSAVAHLLFVHLEHREYAKAYGCESPFLKEFRLVLRSESRLAEIGLLMRIADQWQKAAEPLQVYEEQKLIGHALETAAARPFTRAEAAEVIERAGDDHPEYTRPIRALVKKVLREDPQDPQFRLWRFGFERASSSGLAGNRAELQSIAEEASRRRDEAALRRARQMLRDFDAPPADPFDAVFDGPEDEADIESEEGPPPEFAELIEALRSAPPAVVRELRKSAAAREIPEFVFDTLVKMAKGGSLPPLPPSSVPRRGKPASPPEASQMDLF